MSGYGEPEYDGQEDQPLTVMSRSHSTTKPQFSGAGKDSCKNASLCLRRVDGSWCFPRSVALDKRADLSVACQ